MKLEKEIKQNKPFQSIYEKAMVNLMYTTNWLRIRHKDFFESYELTPKQYNILRILKGANRAVGNVYIRERLLDQVSDVSRILDRMYAKGLIEKSASDKDKRRVDVELSQKGKNLIQKVSKDRPKMDNLISTLSEKDVLSLNILLDRIRSAEN